MDIGDVGQGMAQSLQGNQNCLSLTASAPITGTGGGAVPTHPGLCGLEECLSPRAPRGQCRNLRLTRSVYVTRSQPPASCLVPVLCAKHNSEKLGASKVSSSTLSSPHSAQAYIFSNDVLWVESLQSDETCSSIFWGQFFMTET